MQCLLRNGMGANQSNESYTCDLLRAHNLQLQLSFDWLVSAPYRDKCPTSVNNVYLGSWADARLLPSI